MNGEPPSLFGASAGPQEVKNAIEMKNKLNTPESWVIASSLQQWLQGKSLLTEYPRTHGALCAQLSPV